MDKYAILRIKGKQYKVVEGQEILVDKINGDGIDVEVLLYKKGSDLQIGKPVLDKVKTNVKVINAQEKGKKVDVFKYKSKSRYRKHIGFRPKYTRVLVENLG